MPAHYRFCSKCGGVIDTRGCCAICLRDGVQPGHFICFGQDADPDEAGYYIVYRDLDHLDHFCPGHWKAHPEKSWLKEWRWICTKLDDEK